MSDEEAIIYLSSLRQIGRWSAEMILLFTYNRSNIWPIQDIGLLRSISKNYKKKYLPSEKFVKLLQKKLIVDEITGSNVALVYKEGSVVYFNIQNSGKIGDKNISNQSYKPYKETIFPIWSMSKPITTIAVLILREKNLLKFDDPVYKYIPSYANLKCKSVNGIVDCKNELKVIHLLTHTSGFIYYDDFMLDAIRSENL